MPCMAVGVGPSGGPPSAVRSLRSPSRLFLAAAAPHTRAHCSRAVPALRTKCVRAFAVACGFPSVRCGRPVRLPLLPSWSPALPLLCALRVLPGRCACACCPRPLRRGAPAAASLPRSGALRPPSASLRLPGPPPGPCPPALALGPCAPLRGSVASRWPRCAWAALRPLRASCAALRSPLLCSVRPLALRGFPAGAPWARPLRLRASGRRLRLFAPVVAFAPALRFASPAARAASGAVGSGPWACAGRWPACFGLRPRGLLAARGGLPPLAVRCLRLLRWLRGSPLPPPRPCRPLRGLAGSARPPALGAPAPGPSGLPLSSGCFRVRLAALPLSAARQGFPPAGLWPRP